ncbi:hypothetical protein Hanom_Chr08g00720311 [Helianthus anomalus]
MFTPNCRSYHFFQKFKGGVLNLPKSCTLCRLGQTQLEFSVKLCHVQGTLCPWSLGHTICDVM